MTTNQELREQLKAMRVSKLQAEAERDLLQHHLAQAEKEAKVCATVSFATIMALVAFIVVSDLVW